jgi:threonine aldolase
MTIPTPDGKLTPDLIATQAYGWGFEHRAQPAVVSLTQVTELGTLYRPAEIAANAEFAHRHNMALHVDGARLWNAAAALGMSMREFTTDAGVDILSLGATKVGALGAEAIVVINPDKVDGLIYLRKLSMQLASKMRFISAQILALFDDGNGIRAAGHANAMAARLRDRLEDVAGLSFAQPTESNAVFAVLDRVAAERIRDIWKFYDWDEFSGMVRWMCSFDTTAEDVDRFAATIRSELAG